MPDDHNSYSSTIISASPIVPRTFTYVQTRCDAFTSAREHDRCRLDGARQEASRSTHTQSVSLYPTPTMEHRAPPTLQAHTHTNDAYIHTHAFAGSHSAKVKVQIITSQSPSRRESQLRGCSQRRSGLGRAGRKYRSPRSAARGRYASPPAPWAILCRRQRVLGLAPRDWLAQIMLARGGEESSDQISVVGLSSRSQ